MITSLLEEVVPLTLKEVVIYLLKQLFFDQTVLEISLPFSLSRKGVCKDGHSAAPKNPAGNGLSRPNSVRFQADIWYGDNFIYTS